MRSRLTLANGVILSRINYLIQVWGGTNKTMIKKMQVLVNNTARFVCNWDARSSTRSLMIKCNWLYVHESIDYFSLITLWNFKWRNKPFHFSFKIMHGPDNTLITSPTRLISSQSAYRWRSTNVWNSMPETIREIPSLPGLNRLSESGSLQDDRNIPTD